MSLESHFFQFRLNPENQLIEFTTKESVQGPFIFTPSAVISRKDSLADSSESATIIPVREFIFVEIELLNPFYAQLQIFNFELDASMEESTMDPPYFSMESINFTLKSQGSKYLKVLARLLPLSVGNLRISGCTFVVLNVSFSISFDQPLKVLIVEDQPNITIERPTANPSVFLFQGEHSKTILRLENTGLSPANWFHFNVESELEEVCRENSIHFPSSCPLAPGDVVEMGIDLHGSIIGAGQVNIVLSYGRCLPALTNPRYFRRATMSISVTVAEGLMVEAISAIPFALGFRPSVEVDQVKDGSETDHHLYHMASEALSNLTLSSMASAEGLKPNIHSSSSSIIDEPYVGSNSQGYCYLIVDLLNRSDQSFIVHVVYKDQNIPRPLDYARISAKGQQRLAVPVKRIPRAKGTNLTALLRIMIFESFCLQWRCLPDRKGNVFMEDTLMEDVVNLEMLWEDECRFEISISCGGQQTLIIGKTYQVNLSCWMKNLETDDHSDNSSFVLGADCLQVIDGFCRSVDASTAFLLMGSLSTILTPEISHNQDALLKHSFKLIPIEMGNIRITAYLCKIGEDSSKRIWCKEPVNLEIVS